MIESDSGNPAGYRASNVPRGACRHVYIQALDTGNCATSNVLLFQ